MVKISACVIMRNEEKHIGDCLKSLYDQVDEIIVVDTGSEDQSVAIAKEYTEKLYFCPWTDDFSESKNFALAKTTGDWVVFLDADEYFSPNCQKNIRGIIEQYAGKQVDALQVPMTNIDIDHGNLPMDTFFSLRIFRRSQDLRYVGKIHENLLFSDGREKKIAYLQQNELLLYHTGYSAQRTKEKCQRNLLLLKKELAENPQRKFIYRYLADAYYGLSDYENAEKYARLDIRKNDNLEYEASRSYRILYEAARQLNRKEKNLKAILEDCMRRFPLLPDFYAEYAFRLYQQKKYSKALWYFLKAESLYNAYNDSREYCMLSKSMDVVYKIMAELFHRKGNELQEEAYKKKILHKI